MINPVILLIFLSFTMGIVFLAFFQFCQVLGERLEEMMIMHKDPMNEPNSWPRVLTRK
jgi:uncharacterized integral membrane protein